MPHEFIGHAVAWDRAKDVPNENLECYAHQSSFHLNRQILCVDDQFSGGETVCPMDLLLNAVSLAHMFAFVEHCGKNDFAIQSYRDEPIAYMNEHDDTELSKIILSPIAFFEGEIVPSINEVSRLHSMIKTTGTMGKLLGDKIHLRLN